MVNNNDDIYLLCYRTQSTHEKRKSAQKGKKHLTTNMCIDHQLIP